MQKYGVEFKSLCYFFMINMVNRIIYHHMVHIVRDLLVRLINHSFVIKIMIIIITIMTMTKWIKQVKKTMRLTKPNKLSSHYQQNISIVINLIWYAQYCIILIIINIFIINIEIYSGNIHSSSELLMTRHNLKLSQSKTGKSGLTLI